MVPEVLDRPALRIATVAHRGPYHEIGQAFARLAPIAAAAGLLDGGTTMVAVYHDNPAEVSSDQLRSDAGIVLAAAAVPPGLTEAVLPAGRYLHGRHHGSYAGLPDAWKALRQALKDQGHRRGDGPSYEVYPSNPGTAAPADLVTEIYIPLG